MINILEKSKCSGCSACMAVCPVNCIRMIPDEEGFLYPVADREKCINCGYCEDVCPVQSPVECPPDDVCTYAVRSNDKSNLMASTSGGFFKALADEIISSKGVVCTSSFDDNFFVNHEMIFEISKESYSRARGSKYVQSNLKNSFIKIKQFLREDKKVCFLGTPCQVQGLIKSLGDNPPNLITVDLVCHGVPSPLLWGKYLEYQTKKYSSPISEIRFRSKKYGYHSGGYMELSFANGSRYCASARIDYMLKAFFYEIASRPICYACPFKTLNRCSDLTLYDCWHFSALVDSKEDDDCGYTNVIIQSKKGADIFRELKNDIQFYKVDTFKAKELDGVMICSCAKPHSDRSSFYKTMSVDGLEKAVQLYIPVKRLDKLIERVKIVLYRLHLLSLLKIKFK